MSRVHGRNTYISIDASDISQHCNTSGFTRSAGAFKTTGYQASRHTYEGDIPDATFECGGLYDNTAGTGPRAVLNGQEGTTMLVVRRVEGTGAGKPEDEFSAILTEYVESSPLEGMVTWSAKFQVTGAIDSTVQA